MSKNYKKSSGTMLEAFWATKTVTASLLHAPPLLAARGFTRRRKKSRQQGISEIASSLLLSWLAVTCKTRKEMHTTVDFTFVLLSRFVLGFLRSVLLSFSLPFISVSTADLLLYRRSMALSSGHLLSDYRGAGAWLVVGGFCWICHVWAAAGGEGNVERWLCWLKEMKRLMVAVVRPPLGPNGGETWR